MPCPFLEGTNPWTAGSHSVLNCKDFLDIWNSSDALHFRDKVDHSDQDTHLKRCMSFDVLQASSQAL